MPHDTQNSAAFAHHEAMLLMPHGYDEVDAAIAATLSQDDAVTLSLYAHNT